MKIDKIITMASAPVRLQFLAMERSLRATGCTLPIRVIPFNFNEPDFNLPEGSEWWECTHLKRQMQNLGLKGCAKYQVFTERNYQFVDTDVCFLSNPETVLEAHTGLVAADVQLFAVEWAVIESSQAFLQQHFADWRFRIFNAGQFASDRGCSVEELVELMQNDAVLMDCLKLGNHDQPGINLFPSLCCWPITNLCLPPTLMASTWAGNYQSADISSSCQPCMPPYLMHWASFRIDGSRAVDELFLQHLTRNERSEFINSNKSTVSSTFASTIRSALGRAKRAVRILVHGHDHTECMKMTVNDSMKILKT